jgi:hypothetical protein
MGGAPESPHRINQLPFSEDLFLHYSESVLQKMKQRKKEKETRDASFFLQS